MSQTVRTIPITPLTRRRAAAAALSRSPKVIRLTPGQRKAIIDGTAAKKR